MSEPLLRPLTPEDAPAIAALAESLPEWFNRDVPGLACADAARCPGVAAVREEGALLGLVIWEHLETDTDIKWIMVAPELHGQGIGRKLMEHVIVQAKAAGRARLIVSTVAPTVDYEPYARSRAFYEAQGFVLEKVEVQPDGWPDGTDKATYALELRDGGSAMNRTSVRPATEQDSEAIVALWRELMAVHQELAPLVWRLSDDAEARYREHLGKMLQDPDRRVFVAEQESEVVGYLVVQKGTRPPVLAHSTRGIFGEIFVSPSARCRGVGRELVEAGLRWFREEGLAMAEVSYASDNPMSVPFWEGLGFRRYQVAGVRSLAVERPCRSQQYDGDCYFASVAESYDRLQPVIAGPSYEAGLGFVLDFLPREAGNAFTCVELGCGTATLTDRVLSRFPRATAVAVDSEPGMLEVARGKLEKHGPRAQVWEADVMGCEWPRCDIALSSFMFHHVPPERLEEVLKRIAQALTPGGCFLLLDQMAAGPDWGEQVGAQSRRLYRARVAAAIAAGVTTQEEMDARWEFKRRMKAEGKEVEYRHDAGVLLAAMQAVGFAEVGMVWRMFAATALVGFTGS